MKSLFRIHFHGQMNGHVDHTTAVVSRTAIGIPQDNCRVRVLVGVRVY